MNKVLSLPQLHGENTVKVIYLILWKVSMTWGRIETRIPGYSVYLCELERNYSLLVSVLFYL